MGKIYGKYWGFVNCSSPLAMLVVVFFFKLYKLTTMNLVEEKRKKKISMQTSKKCANLPTKQKILI
jgi:hypothetical protein